MIINEEIARGVNAKDKDFFDRVYCKDSMRKYKERIKRIGFLGDTTKVLDAGCGFGQWSFALAQCNQEVFSIDIDSERLKVLKCIANDNNINNIKVKMGCLEKLPYEDETFDFIFCYSVIYMADWKKAIDEMIRVSRADGLIYICSNDIEWYYNMIINEPNKNHYYHPRYLGIQAFINEYRYKAGENDIMGVDKVVRLQDIKKYIFQKNGKVIISGGEGTIKKQGSNYILEKSNDLSFFKSEYFGELGVYELIVQK